MELDASVAERTLADIVRTLTLSLRGSRTARSRAILLASDSAATERCRHDTTISMTLVAKPVLEEVARLVKERASDSSDVPLLLQFMFDRPWFDISCEIADDTILFRIARIHEIRDVGT